MGEEPGFGFRVWEEGGFEILLRAASCQLVPIGFWLEF